MASTSAQSAAPGRPRSLEAKHAALAAARALFEKGGYPAATIEAIAARSGVAKTTIYRWWPNRPALLVDLLVQISSAAAPPPAGGDPLRELRTELRLVAEASEALPGRLLISLLGEAQCDPEIHKTLMQGLFNPRRHATAKVIRRAQLSGALREDVPPLVAVDLFFGPLFYRRFIRHEPVTGSFVKQVFEHVMAGMQAQPAGRRKRRPQ
jgi:AcrR family transcriptional regulator